MKKLLALLILSLTLLVPQLASAHCDAMDGPVVSAARKALESGKIGLVLAWVQPKDEPEVRAAFEKALAVRKLSPDAKDLADRYFFETLVRVHRAGEGAPYTGLKPAGTVKDPALAAADKAIDTGKLEPVSKLLDEAVKAGLAERFAHVRALKAPGDDVGKGREWVEAYVAYVHYVVGLYHAAAGKGGAHEEAGESHAKHREN